MIPIEVFWGKQDEYGKQSVPMPHMPHLGGDSDTIAAITGSIAEAYYAIPQDLYDFAMSKPDIRLREIVTKFMNLYVGTLWR